MSSKMFKNYIPNINESKGFLEAHNIINMIYVDE